MEDLSRVDQFLMLEFSSLREQRKSIAESSHSEVTVFFAAVAAVGLALGFVAGKDPNDHPTRSTYLLAALVCSLTLLIGLATLRRLIKYHLQSQTYARGMNLIRGHFIPKEDKEHSYLLVLPNEPILPASANLTADVIRMNVIFTNAVVVVLLNSGIASAAVFCLCLSILSEGVVAIACAVIAGMIVWYLQDRLQRRWISINDRNWEDSIMRSECERKVQRHYERINAQRSQTKFNAE